MPTIAKAAVADMPVSGMPPVAEWPKLAESLRFVRDVVDFALAGMLRRAG